MNDDRDQSAAERSATNGRATDGPATSYRQDDSLVPVENEQDPEQMQFDDEDNLDEDDYHQSSNFNENSLSKGT